MKRIHLSLFAISFFALSPIIAQTVATKANPLPSEETASRWKLLFNGNELAGWSNFKSDSIKPGWQIQDGTLAWVNPHNAGDLATAEQYEWFELQVDFKMGEGANSGIMYHASPAGRAAWATGTEFQLEDNAKATDPRRRGLPQGGESRLNSPEFRNTARSLTAAVHEEESDVIFQGCLFEIMTQEDTIKKLWLE
ncbi:MAG: hypothetical protein ACI9R3_002372 [Verrucomicrobiales bacterium]|jgi:hypothetical protein